jgi:hypothetical protein
MDDEQTGLRRRLVAESGRYERPTAIDRARIIRLLEERRYEDVLVLLRAAHRRRPHDLEVLKSLRILELHLGAA